MFRASQHPSSGVLKTLSATSGIGHDTGTATSFQRGLIRPRWKEVAVPGKITGHFSPTVSPSAAGCSRLMTCMETHGGECWNV